MTVTITRPNDQLRLASAHSLQPPALHIPSNHSVVNVDQCANRDLVVGIIKPRPPGRGPGRILQL